MGIQWNDTLEKAIRDFSDYEKNVAEAGLDPNKSVSESIELITAWAKENGNSRYQAACGAMGVESGVGQPDYMKRYWENVQKMIDMAAENGSDAADMLVRTQALWKKVAEFSNDPVERMQMAKDRRLTL